MRILVTGGQGAVASYAREAFDGWDVARNGRDVLNVTKRSEILRAISATHPDVVLHLAAITDVDWCQQNPREANAVNALGTQNVATVCRQQDVRMVYVSTAGVFGREAREFVPYTEIDEPDPANTYGETKASGEKLAVAVLPEVLIVRSGWMFGGGGRDTKFVGKMISQLAAGSVLLRAVDDKAGSPTYALDLLRLVRGLLEREAVGLYHGANTGPAATRWDVAAEIVRLMSRNETGPVATVERALSSEFPLPAPRADSEVIVSNLLPQDLLPPDWRVALEEYLLAQGMISE